MDTRIFKSLYVRIENLLTQFLQQEIGPATRLNQAIHYATLAQGKRLRPLLVYASGLTFTDNLALLDSSALAVELIHTYSLIHDDLPAMDDDDLRRGKPTCHKQFDEATAILAGDALQSLAFHIIADQGSTALSADTRLQLIELLAQASGTRGMAAGQMLDLQAENNAVTQTEIETIHRLKTGALIKASVLMGAIAGGCRDAAQLQQLTLFSEHVGLAFQIQDDILDIESATSILGKTQGADIAKNKATYPAACGIVQAKRDCADLFSQALSALTHFQNTQLTMLTQALQARQF